MRMDAYYYGFEPTDVQEIDQILSAVAWAGKAFHSTDQWQEEIEYGPYQNESPQDYIQRMANNAADLWRQHK